MEKSQFVTCCNETAIKKQKDVMATWDPSLIQVQLNYFAPCCNKCNKKPPSLIIDLKYSFQDIIKSYWISLRGISVQRDKIALHIPLLEPPPNCTTFPFILSPNLYLNAL